MYQPVDKENTYYIVEVALKPENSIRTQGSKGYSYQATNVHWEFLTREDWCIGGHGGKCGAMKFSVPPTVEHIRKFSGFPWYCVHDKRYTPRFYKITETTKEELIVT